MGRYQIGLLVGVVISPLVHAGWPLVVEGKYGPAILGLALFVAVATTADLATEGMRE